MTLLLLLEVGDRTQCEGSHAGGAGGRPKAEALDYPEEKARFGRAVSGTTPRKDEWV